MLISLTICCTTVFLCWFQSSDHFLPHEIWFLMGKIVISSYQMQHVNWTKHLRHALNAASHGEGPLGLWCWFLRKSFAESSGIDQHFPSWRHHFFPWFSYLLLVNISKKIWLMKKSPYPHHGIRRSLNPESYLELSYWANVYIPNYLGLSESRVSLNPLGWSSSKVAIAEGISISKHSHIL